jgi:hypothetical protein
VPRGGRDTTSAQDDSALYFAIPAPLVA